MDTLDFRFNSSGFLTPFPDVEPVFSLCVLAGVHDIEHEFCWVLVRFTRSGAVALKVVQEGAAVFANFAKVDRFTTASEEEESIELLEEDGAGLVDCAENCLTVVCQLPQERANSPG